ncbi:MAG: hypothetical protein H7836_14110 [Magnetococcus sp. YQC-3]
MGSINLIKFIKNPFSEFAEIDWDKYIKIIHIFNRLLDNVIEISGLPLPIQLKEIKEKRRRGIGIFGLSSALTMLNIKYGSDESLKIVERIYKILAIESYKSGVELSIEKGPAPILENTENRKHFIKSKYLQQFPQELLNNILTYGCRFTHSISQAPAGTLSLTLGNNASNGCEPTFMHYYKRNIIEANKKTKMQTDVYSYELLLYKKLVNPNVDIDNLPDIFVTSHDLTPDQHVNVQSVIQKWVDSAVSKTVNCKDTITFEEFKNLYLYAHEMGLKGITTYVPRPEKIGVVLVDPNQQKNTKYKFKLENGEELILSGNEKIKYDGEEHVAANLAEAIKENQFGKF